MSGEYFEVVGEETGESYASGSVLTDDTLEAAYFLNELYDQAYIIRGIWQVAERLELKTVAPDPMDDVSRRKFLQAWLARIGRVASPLVYSYAYVSQASQRVRVPKTRES